MPEFLDLMFSFGDQEYAKDFHFSGFFVNNRHCKNGLKMSRTQLCYKLESVEESSTTTSLRNPWSIRQTVVHHSFDEDTGRAAWILVKGNSLIKHRLKSEKDIMKDLRDFMPLNTFDAALVETLATHIVLCTWSVENWRWYVNFLEERLQDVSRHGKNVIVDPYPGLSDDKEKTTVRYDSMPFQLARSATTTTITAVRRVVSSSRSKPLPGPHAGLPAVTSIPLLPLPESPSSSSFLFRDLQEVHTVSEKASEALLILRNNSEVLAGLKEHYTSNLDTHSTSQLPGSARDEYIAHFRSKLSNLQRILRMQQTRVETLGRLAEDRKSLVFCMSVIG